MEEKVQIAVMLSLSSRYRGAVIGKEAYLLADLEALRKKAHFPFSHVAVESVEIIVPAAAGEDEEPKLVFLDGERAKRAEKLVRARWTPPIQVVRVERLEIRPGRLLTGWVTAEGMHEQVIYALSAYELESILHGEAT